MEDKDQQIESIEIFFNTVVRALEQSSEAFHLLVPLVTAATSQIGMEPEAMKPYNDFADSLSLLAKEVDKVKDKIISQMNKEGE